MRLGREEIAKMIHHVMAYEYDEEGNLHFKRFTPSQYETIRLKSRDWQIRANASASVAFDFISDSDDLTLMFDLYPGSAVEWAAFDLYVDGIFYEHWYMEHKNVKQAVFHLPAGEHRITLYFPWSAETVVKEVHVSDGARIAEVKKRARAIVFGDSITQGYTTRFPSLTYVNQVARNLDLELLNQGIGGSIFDESWIEESLVPYAPDLLLIAYGTNDYSRYDAEEEFRKNASAYIKKLAALFPHTKKLAILPLYRKDQAHQLREQSRSYTFEDARNILLAEYGRHKNIRVLRETGIPRISEAFAGDYLHPNELGFTFVARSIEEQVRDII